VTAQPDGTSQLTLELEQSGWLSGVVSLFLGRRVREYVDLEAEALKDTAEAA
jgi:hypothetical protein